LDYLAGRSLDPAYLPATAAWHPVPPSARRLELVRGIGFTEPTSPTAEPTPFPTEALLAGLAGERLPLAFQVVGGPDGVRFHVGTWGPAGVLQRQHDVLTSLLDGIYPSVDRVDVGSGDPLAAFPKAAVVHGVPGGKVVNGETPWDRLLRGLHGANFAVVTLAEPVDGTRLTALRDSALEELRTASAAQHARTDQPLTQAYAKQVEGVIASLNRALAVGGWRTGVYLLGDDASYLRLAAAWRSVFSDGERPQLPLRVVPCPDAARLAAGWALPDQPAPAGPRVWRHPYLNQTLLDTRQLASFAHLPRLDTPGFAVRPAPAFAVARQAPKDPSRAVTIGDVLAQRKPTGTSYRIDLDQLTRHSFIAGLTGSGKTNTLMHLLTEASDADIPFLVIEPAKTEYRELLGRPGIGEKLRVFTLGREQVAPLRINPFEVPDGIDVSTHLDLLKAVFMASFAMWIPLPQVLEQCLVQLYAERGWDFTTGDHRGGRSAVSPDVPTLGELVASVERTVPTLGYKPESTQEITASLTTRLNALRRGTRGLMLDVERSIPVSELLSAPTVIELEGLGDDADKAFVMGLLLIRLYEHRRAEQASRLALAAASGQAAPPSGTLSHIVVIEEAHRLLAETDKPTDSWNADPQGAFAETFSQMLSEVRAYGQAMVIADQVPVRLAPDVLKNTNLKIAHRLVAGDDRNAMAATMSMDDKQSRMLATLPVGRAAVFSEGDHTPVIVAVRKAKNLDDATAIDDAAVARAMAAWRTNPAIAAYFADNEFCSGVCRSSGECREARQLAEDPAGRLLAGRLFNTAVSHPDGLDVVWPDVVAYVSSRTQQRADLDSRVHGFAVHAMHLVVSRRATQGEWSAADLDAITISVRDAIEERVAGSGTWLGATPARRALIDSASELMRRTHDPYPLCAAICLDGTCRYRDSMADVLVHPRHAGFATDLDDQPEPEKYVLQVAGYAANDVIAVSDEAPSGADELTAARWRATGCAAQVKFCADDHPKESAATVESALSTAGWNVTTNGSHPMISVASNGDGPTTGA
ncbi:MAG: ATP-binding protein, partial [Micromonosporaceae bacterium]